MPFASAYVGPGHSQEHLTTADGHQINHHGGNLCFRKIQG